MSDHLQRLSQSIRDATEHTDNEVAQRKAALVVNSVGVQSAPKRQERTTAFEKAVNSLAGTIGKRLAAKAAETKVKTAEPATAEAVPTLAELLSGAAQDSK